MKCLEENIGDNLCDLGAGQDFFWYQKDEQYNKILIN